MKVNPEELVIGLSTPQRCMPYTWRDAALYALAVGAKAEELHYTYEKAMKTLPTFGTVPYWGTVNVSPRLPRPCPAAQLAGQRLGSVEAPLHLEHQLLLHRPIDPIQGTLVFQDVVTDLYDRGDGRGAVVATRCQVYDEAGNLVCTNLSSTLYPDLGGFGGKPLPKSPLRIPSRAPDRVIGDQISPVQHLLYRLTGDTNLIHVDPDYARQRGYGQVFLQGLCSFGFACRMAIGALFPGQPERLRRIGAQMRSLAYPDSPITLSLWREEEGRALFRLTHADTGAAILDRGLLEWE